ncbi:low affinity immunoglobulin gamma Fc region receptor II-like isoform X3 [Denticeps clupeoides]|uniref:low affinity immunoglobulin gamma Fc region receptor II-like isoform X3 n=1 Tax=Denticeps clupeoides TaxID=299321 RepID=UPI0010A4308E|nr:low affinity immunoglobulin gamma Fc region receptor II-like isoform X3 [Denticeps clupeoides]
MELNILHLLLLLTSVVHSALSQGEIKTVLRLEPSRTQIFPGDSVTLICDTEPKSEPTGRYKFYMKPEHQDHEQHLTFWIKENNYNITSVKKKSDSGSYWCERYGIDTEGDRLHVIVSELVPTVTVVSPQRPFYSGDTVTLSCDITPQYTDWELYFWYRDGTCITSKTSRTINISLPDEAGQYSCSGRRAGRPKMSSTSSSFTVSYQDLPTPALTVHPQMSSTSASSTGSVQVTINSWSWRLRLASSLAVVSVYLLLTVVLIVKVRGTICACESDKASGQSIEDFEAQADVTDRRYLNVAV